MTKNGLFAAIAIVASTLAGGPLEAQTPPIRAQLGGLQMTRADLQDLLDRNQQVLGSSAYSATMRERARRDVEMILSRLDEGDFRIGDRIILLIEGEWTTADTFVVEAGPQITLPILGEIPLRGVLRSELEDHLTEELGRFIQQPVVHAETTIRLFITGAVGNQGFFNVGSTLLVGEAVMRAGIAGNADLDDIRITRREFDRDVDIWEGDPLQDALATGLTLDQMNLQAGDQIVVPEETSSRIWSSVIRYGVVLGTFALFGIRVFF